MIAALAPRARYNGLKKLRFEDNEEGRALPLGEKIGKLNGPGQRQRIVSVPIFTFGVSMMVLPRVRLGYSTPSLKKHVN
jgi:hypothetical protein